MTSPDTPDTPATPTTPGLTAVVRELEQHASQAGWDRPAALFALVPTAELIARESGLADVVDPDDVLTPVQQEELPAEELETLLQQIVFPAEVEGVAAVVERLVLPPGADAEMPEDAEAAASYAAEHPDRQDVRIVAAVTRDGAAWQALRLRAHDEDEQVITGADLVPQLVELLRGCLEEFDDE